jgi:hypothetical protein
MPQKMKLFIIVKLYLVLLSLIKSISADISKQHTIACIKTPIQHS